MALPKKTYIQNCTGSQLKNGECGSQSKFNSELAARITFYVLVAIFLGVTVYVLFFSTYLKISNIVIRGNEELITKAISNVIEKKQQGKFFGIIPKDNFLLISKSEAERSLLEEFKKIKEVLVIKKFPDTLEIVLQERKALLVLCNGEKCFLIDENGIAYNEADFGAPELTQNHLIKITDQSSKSIQLGDVVMSQEYIGFVSTLKEALQKFGLIISDEYWTPSIVADEIKVKTDQESELYFSTQFPIEISMKTLDVLLKKELLKTDLKEVAYIDLRTEGKVFYKLKNFEPPIDENQKVENVEPKKVEKK